MKTEEQEFARRAAVYRYLDAAGSVLYVGCSIDPDSRDLSHHAADWYPRATARTVDWYDSVTEAMAAERRAIAADDPEFNGHRYGAPTRHVRVQRVGRAGMKVVSVRVEQGLYDEVERLADEADVDVSRMVRRLLAYADESMPKGWKLPREQK